MRRFILFVIIIIIIIIIILIMRFKCCCGIGVFCCTIVWILYYISYQHVYPKLVVNNNSYQTNVTDRSCRPTTLTVDRSSPLKINDVVKRNVFFLKTHKCGSSTVQNILMRFGYDNSLDFVLPEIQNYIGNPRKFDKNMIVPALRTHTDRYNIFAHHTRYDRSNVSAVMYADAIYTTILRNPSTHFESLFNYYKLNRTYHVNLTDILADEKKATVINRGTVRKLGLNQMCWDLGMEQSDFGNDGVVDRFVEQIDREFDLVMITEYSQASLILFAELMNWPLERVAYLKLNSRSSVQNLTEEDRVKLRRLNSCDAKLYSYFLEKFKRRIRAYGLDNMRRKLAELTTLNFSLHRKCVREETNVGYAKTVRYTLRPNRADDWTCMNAVKRELVFTEEIRLAQMQRIKTIDDFNKLMRPE